MTTTDPDNGKTGASVREAKVAYVTSRFPKLTETFILREILALARMGQPVEIFPLLDVQQSIRHPEAETLTSRIHYTPYLNSAILAANIHYLRRRPRRYMAALWLAFKDNIGSANLLLRALMLFPKSVYNARVMNSIGICHVHAHFATHGALSALIIECLTDIPFSFTAHAHDIFVRPGALRAKLARSRYVIVISNFNKTFLLERYPDIDEHKFHVIHCGIELERYPERQFPRRDGQINILSVASLEPYKGIEHLIRACGQLSGKGGFFCRIVGDGRLRSELQNLIEKLGLTECVHLLGARTQEEVGELLAQADLFVLPSVIAADGQMEGIPVALMEAMASGLPVIASRLSYQTSVTETHFGIPKGEIF